MAKMKKYETVEGYLADQPKEVRETLEHVRDSVLAVVPDATQKIGYGMPGFYVDGRPLPAGDDAARRLEGWRGIGLDATYSAKAFAAAIALHRSTEVPTLFWLTFDGRALRLPTR